MYCIVLKVKNQIVHPNSDYVRVVSGTSKSLNWMTIAPTAFEKLEPNGRQIWAICCTIYIHILISG